MPTRYLNLKTTLKALAIGFILSVSFYSLIPSTFAAAGINKTINFQGKVVNKSTGTNVTNGAYDFSFRLYGASSGGSPLWTENWTSGDQITVTDGIFRASLGSITTFASAGVDFNSDSLYLEIDFNGQTFTTQRIRLAAVPYAFNAEKVAGLTVTNTTGTLTIPNSKTISFADAFTTTGSNPLTLATTGTTSVTLPLGGTLLTNTVASAQTITSTQASGTILGVADSTTLSGGITGFNIALTSATNSQNKTGISFDLSGGTSGTYYDLLGTGSTWSITRGGVLTVTSCTGCGGGSPTPWTVDIDADNWSLLDLGTNITARAALTVASGGSSALTLDSASGTVTLGSGDHFTVPGNLTLSGSLASNINFLDAATGSSFNINGSDATGSTNAGGALSIRAGNGGATSGDGGDLTFAGGTTNSGTAGFIAFQTGGSERLRVTPTGTFLFEKGSSIDVILSVTAASGGDRTLTIPQLTADDTFALVTKTQTLAGKTLTSPTLTTAPTAAGATWTDLGAVTTADINGGTLDGAVIGGSSAAAGSFTSLGSATLNLGVSGTASITTQDTDEALTINPNGTGAINFHGSTFALTSTGVLGIADLTLGTSDSSATVTTADTNENLFLDPNGTGYVYVGNGSSSTSPNLFVLDLKSDAEGALTGVEGAMYYNDSTNKFRCYQNTGWTDCIGTGGAGPFTDGTGITYLTDVAEDLALGGSNLPTTASSTTTFYMDVSAGMLFLGNDVNGDTGINGGLTFYSSGNVSDPTITTDSSGNLTISAPQSGAQVVLGDGTGNIELQLRGLEGDVYLADKTFTLTTAWSGNDFSLTRALTSNSGTKNQSGSVLYVTDTSSISGGATSTGSLIVANSALSAGTFAGNLIDLQVGGTTKAKINYQGVLTLVGGQTADILTSGATTLKIDAGGAAGLSLGLANANAITIGRSGITTTVDSGLTLTTGRTLTVNADAFTDLTGNGLEVSSNALTVKVTASADALSSTTSSGSGLQVLSGGLTLLQGCSAGQVLAWDEASDVWTCTTQSSSPFKETAASGIIEMLNNKNDVLIGGSSSSSAKFAFTGLSSGDFEVNSNGSIRIGARPNSVVDWAKKSQAAGTVAEDGGATTAIDKISASAIYNGSLYVGTTETDKAEVYRYDANGTWTQLNVTGTPGKFNTTTAIDGVASMTVYNGYLYISTTESTKAEVYRYDGGTTWTQQNFGGTAGSLGNATASNTVINTIILGVHNGNLYAGTQKSNAAQVFWLNGTNLWAIAMGSTAGNVCGTASIDGITVLASYQGALFAGTTETGKAQVCRYDGNTATTTNAAVGGFGNNGTLLTVENTVNAMVVYNGALYATVNKGANTASLVRFDGGGAAATNWSVINTTAGTLGGTASIDSFESLAVYNGNLYLGTNEADKAEVYRYEGGGSLFTLVTNTTPGGIPVSSPPTTLIDTLEYMQVYGNELWAFTTESNKAEAYVWSSYEGQSYSLKFNAASNNANAEQNGLLNEGRIQFLAEEQARNNQGNDNTGRFIFSHGLNTAFGAYDVAEDYPTRDEELEAGDLVSIDIHESTFVKRTDKKHDSKVVGILSTNPALRLSQQDATINGGRAVPVALAGRVPIKVSTESGAIESGDFLTSSSIPGVAMKAVGNVPAIAQAMEPFNGSEVGKVIGFIRGATYTTQSLVDGIETVDLKGQSIVFRNGKGEEIIKFDEDGNAYFTGTVTAKNIKAEKIEGLELLIEKISSKKPEAENVLGLSDEDKIASITAKLSERLATSSAFTKDSLAISFSSDGLASASGIRVKGNGLIEGILTVIDTLKANNLIATGLSTFFGESVFKDKTSFEGDVVLSKKSGGVVTLKKGQRNAYVTFEKELENDPIVNVSIYLPELTKEQFKSLVESKDCIESDEISECDDKISEEVLSNNSYVITKKSKKGFNILLKKVATDNINFSWTLVNIKDLGKEVSMN